MAKQHTQVYTLSGRITDQQGQAIEGLTVRAFDQDPKTPENPLGKEAITDAEGKYNISFTEEDFKIGGKESGGLGVCLEELQVDSPMKRKYFPRLSKNYKFQTDLK